MFLLRNFLQLLLILFSYLVPKNKKLFLIGSDNGNNYIGNPKYFYNYLNSLNNCKFSYFWITENNLLHNKLNKELKPVVFKYSFKGFWLLLRSRFLFINYSTKAVSYSGTLVGRFNIIQFYHGIPLKKIDINNLTKLTGFKNLLYNYFLKKEYKNYKIIISSSAEVKKIYKKVFMNSNVKIFGFPRNDIFFNKRFICEDFSKKLKLYNYKKIFLYAPTFRDKASDSQPFSEDFLNELNSYLENSNYLMLIKKHYADQVFSLGKPLSNIKDISFQVSDVQDLLVSVDVLISDYSSIIFDFLLTGRPIIFYSYDYKEYINNCREMYYDYYHEMVGPFANSKHELFQMIKNIDTWSKDKEYLNKIEKLKNKFYYYQDGNSSKRLYKYLTEKI